MLQPLPIPPTEFVQPASARGETQTMQGIAYAISSSSTTRAGQRRLRTETPTSTPVAAQDILQTAAKDWETFVELIDSSHKAFYMGRYEEALTRLRQGQTLWDTSLVHVLTILSETLPLSEEESAQLAQMLPTIQQLVDVAFLEGEAYLFALLSKQEAITLADEGFKRIMSHIDDIVILARSLDPEEAPEDIQTEITQGYQLYRKFLLFALGKKESALNGLKDHLQYFLSELYTDIASAAERDVFWDDDQLADLFFFKVLEQKLNTPLLPTLSTIDPNDEISLFLAGQYQDVLTLMEKDPELLNPELKGACLALLGQTQEAIHLFQATAESESGESDYADIMMAITYLLQGDLQSALKNYQESSDCTMAITFLMPLTIKGFQWESNTKYPI